MIGNKKRSVRELFFLQSSREREKIFSLESLPILRRQTLFPFFSKLFLAVVAEASSPVTAGLVLRFKRSALTPCLLFSSLLLFWCVWVCWIFSIKSN